MTCEFIELNDGYRVLKDFYECVRHEVEAGLHELKRDKIYTAKKLCGKALWDELDSGEHRMAGRCMAHMVVKGIFPFNFVKSKHEYPIKYQLI